MRVKMILFCAAIMFCFINSFAQDDRGAGMGEGPRYEGENLTNPNIYRLEKRVNKVSNSVEALGELHKNLSGISREVFELYNTANTNLTNNIYKIYLKGSLDIYNKVTSPVNSWLDMANEVILNLAVEPHLWGSETQRIKMSQLNKSVSERNVKLKMLYTSLGKLAAFNAARFDDDKRPLPYTASWWGLPDNKPDDETELITRKLNLLVKLSDVVYKTTEIELKKIREERESLIEELAMLNKNLVAEKAKFEEDVKIHKETEAWFKRMRQRGNVASNNYKDQSLQQFANDPAEVKQKLAELEEAKILKQKAEADKVIEEAKQKKLYEQKLLEAEVYVDSECPRHLTAFEQGLFIARAHPEDIKGIFEFYIDDILISKSKKPANQHTFAKMFPATGVYDMQVKLYIDGRYNDTYTDQIYVDENTTGATAGSSAGSNQPMAYDPAMEGKKNLKVDMGWCKYFTLFEGGNIYLTGYYFLPNGQKVEYKSEPLSPETEPIAQTGLLATKSMTGYHFYKTVSEGKAASYIVTRMRGEKIEIINRFDAVKMNVVPATDMSTITINYKETNDGAEKKIILD